MVDNKKSNDLAEEIPIELLQNGVVINEKEVLQHKYMILEVIIKI